MRQIRALLALLIVLSPQAALACGAMVSERGRAELLGFEAMLRWDGTTEELLVSVDFQTGDPTFGWLMPLPAAPEIEKADLAPIDTAFEITEPPVAEVSDGEGAGAPPLVGGAPGVDVIGRQTIGGLRFVTLGGALAGEISDWMRKRGFAFHDRQEPVLQSYLDRGWIVVAARVAPGGSEFSNGSLVPVRFTFPSAEPTYPLAMTGSGHTGLDLGMTLFVLTPFRPTSSTYAERIVQPQPSGEFSLEGLGHLELRYSAPLGTQADRLDATPETWLSWYHARLIPAKKLTQDLVLSRASDQTPVDYANLEDEGGVLVWVARIGVVLVAVVLAIWISLGMARRRRSAEAPRMPGSGPGA